MSPRSSSPAVSSLHEFIEQNERDRHEHNLEIVTIIENYRLEIDALAKYRAAKCPRRTGTSFDILYVSTSVVCWLSLFSWSLSLSA